MWSTGIVLLFGSGFLKDHITYNLDLSIWLNLPTILYRTLKGCLGSINYNLFASRTAIRSEVGNTFVLPCRSDMSLI
jgi:hypothetical protein